MIDTITRKLRIALFHRKTMFQWAALIAATINGIAAACMLFTLRPGLVPTIPTQVRMDFIASHSLVWKLTWGLWVLAALSLIYFFIQWALFLNQHSPKKYRGVIIFGALVGALGMVPDTIAEILYIGIIPKLASQTKDIADSDMLKIMVSRFMDWEYIATLWTGLLGNGFYSVGGLVLNLVSFKIPQFPKMWAYSSLPIWIFGIGLSVAAFMNSAIGLQVFTGLTMASFVCWSGALGLFFQTKESQ